MKTYILALTFLGIVTCANLGLNEMKQVPLELAELMGEDGGVEGLANEMLADEGFDMNEVDA